MQGIIATTRLTGKSRENPYTRGSDGGEGVLEDTFSGSRPVCTFPAQAPTPGPLNLTEEPNPEKGAKRVLFAPFSVSYFGDPLPLAPLFIKKPEKPSRKRAPLYRLLRLDLGTSKTHPGTHPGDEKWPILWHIWCFPLCGKS